MGLAVRIDVARDPVRELARERDDLLRGRPHEVEEEERALRAFVHEDPVGKQGVKPRSPLTGSATLADSTPLRLSPVTEQRAGSGRSSVCSPR